MTPMWIIIFNNIVFRIPVAYLLAHLTRSPEWPHGKPISTFGSLVLTWLMGTVLISIFYRRGKWKTKH